MGSKDFRQKSQSIKGAKTKIYCKISVTEHALVEEIIIRVKCLPKKSNHWQKQWFKILNPIGLLKQIAGIIKAFY
jgi:hypothetical protein